MAENLRSDGKAVDVVVTRDVSKGDPVLAEGWCGVAMRNAKANETVAIETTQREFAFNIGAETAAKGAVLYIKTDGKLTATAGTDIPFCKVTRAKDSNNIVWAKLLPQVK